MSAGMVGFMDYWVGAGQALPRIGRPLTQWNLVKVRNLDKVGLQKKETRPGGGQTASSPEGIPSGEEQSIWI